MIILGISGISGRCVSRLARHNFAFPPRRVRRGGRANDSEAEGTRRRKRENRSLGRVTRDTWHVRDARRDEKRSMIRRADATVPPRPFYRNVNVCYEMPRVPR